MSEVRPPRPDALDLRPDAVPETLREREQWVAWRYEFDDGRDEWTKVPISVPSFPGSRAGYASSTDPDTWTTFDDAVDYHERDDTTTDGIGFVVHDDGIVAGIDLDDCRDPATGELEDWAGELLEAISTYGEVSPSGTGLRLFGLGFIPEDGNRGDVDDADGHLEMYDSGRYLTVTGHHLEETPTDVHQVNSGLDEIHAEYIADDESPSSDGEEPESPGPNPGVGAGETGGLSDEEVIERAKAAENGDKFRQLWRGDTSAHNNDHSRADLALCGMLAFWTGGDRQQIDRLFRQSGLMRDKWDEDRGAQTYGELTIDKALRGRSDYYTPDEEESSQRAAVETDDPEFRPPEIASLAGVESLSELNDREQAYFLTQQIALSDEIHVLAAQPDGTIYNFEGGVWEETGEQALREVGHRALAAAYGTNIHKELCERIRATRAVDREELGTPSGTVAVENGLLDLEARDLNDLEPEDYALTQLPVEYDPDATAPRWEQFIDEVIEESRRDAIQEYVGYCLLVGELPIHRALMLVGEGSNGKSTFLRVVKALIGEENISAHPLQKLSESEHNVADLYGKVANIHADLSSRGLGDGGMFKTLVGGDTVTGRRLYQEPFSFEATAKQLYSANQVPDVSIDDEAFFRRWLLVEFPTQFTDSDKPGPDKDPELTDDLLDELPGVLNWALDGLDCLMTQGHFTGEGDPLDKRERWLSWGDSISKFIDECIDTSQDGKWPTGEVHSRYTAWCRSELGEAPEAQQTLTKELKNVEGVEYGNYRFDGARERGLKGFGFTDDTPAPETSDDGDDAESADNQTTLTQGAAIEQVLETTQELEDEQGGPVPIEEIVNELTMDDERAHHYLDKLLTEGGLYEPEDGRVATL